jgi:hypothetical protein
VATEGAGASGVAVAAVLVDSAAVALAGVAPVEAGN